MKIECPVCMHRCLLAPGQVGKCCARKNVDGESLSENYGEITALALDPIEKKPLKRFYPGSMILSVGSYGCNMSCPFCQNYHISTCGSRDQAIRIEPQELVQKAKTLEVSGNIGLAFTYNEPLIGFEFVRDTAQLAKEQGLKNVVVTNGSVSEAVSDEILPWIDAMNIDLKGFTEKYYKKLGGDLETVKKFILKAAGHCHVELTTLIVPGENDTPQEMESLSRWVAEMDTKTPLHISRFFPNWKMKDKNPTAEKRIYSLVEIAKKNLQYVYAGNC